MGPVWLSLLGVALVGAGCGEGPSDVSSADEEVGEAQDALETPVCVTVQRGVLGNVADTFLSGDYPFWAPGTEPGLWTGISSAGNENVALYRFDLGFLPPTARVTAATLRLQVSWNDQNNVVFVHRVLAPWSEATARANNFGFPGDFDPVPDSGFLAGGPGLKTVDVTDIAKGWVDGGLPNNGVLLKEPLANRHLFWSSEASLASRPALQVCYVNGPKPHQAAALVAGGVMSDSPGHHFIGTLGESPGGNGVSVSANHRFIGGVVGGTQE